MKSIIPKIAIVLTFCSSFADKSNSTVTTSAEKNAGHLVGGKWKSSYKEGFISGELTMEFYRDFSFIEEGRVNSEGGTISNSPIPKLDCKTEKKGAYEIIGDRLQIRYQLIKAYDCLPKSLEEEVNKRMNNDIKYYSFKMQFLTEDSLHLEYSSPEEKIIWVREKE